MEARLAGSPIAETIPSHSGDTDRKPDLRQAGDQSFEKTGNVPSFTDLPSMPEERRRQLPECIRPGKGFNLLPSEGLAQLGIAAGSEGFRRGYGGGSLFGKACFSEAEVAVFSAPHSPSFSFQCPIGLLSPDTPDPFLDVSQGSLLLRSREATCLSHFISSHCGRFQSCRGHREASKSQGGLPSTHYGLLSRRQALFLPGLARGRGGSDLCSGADLGELEDGSGPGPLPSRSRLLDLFSPACFPAAEAAVCAPAGETPTGLQPGGSQLLLSEGKSRSQRPAFGLGNVAPRAAHAKSAWRPPYVVFPHCGRFQSCRGNPEAAGSQDCR